MRLLTRINGETRQVSCAPGGTLIDLLRSLGLISVREGCDREGMCGSCAVLLDGEVILACITPAAKIAGREVLTTEGLGHPGQPHVLQEAFVETGAVQCGYCTPGMILAAKALLDGEPAPTDTQIGEALSGNLCRCTGYVKIVEAVHRAAALSRQEGSHE